MSDDNKSHPCSKGLTKTCIKKYPEFAKRALAYRLLYLFLPKEISRNLPFGLNQPLVGENAILPTGVDLPAGVVIPPDYDASGIQDVGDLPSSFLPPALTDVVGRQDSGLFPPYIVGDLTPVVHSASAPKYGTLSIMTDPAGATISVDGVEIGVSPLSYDLREGDHVISCSLDGYKTYSENVFIEYMKITTISLILIENDKPFGKITSKTLNSDEQRNQLVFVDNTYQKIYFPTVYPNNKVVEIDAGTFNKTGRAELGDAVNAFSGGYDPVSRVMVIGFDGSPGLVKKVSCSDMSLLGSFSLNSGENVIRGSSRCIHNGYIYFLTDTSPGIVVKCSVSPFERVGALNLGSGYNYPYDAAVDTVANKMYVVCFDTPRKLVVINLASFTVENTKELAGYVGNPKLIIINQPKDYLVVFGSDISTGAEKIRLSTLTRIKEIDYAGTSSGLLHHAYLPDHEIVFLAGLGGSGCIFKISTKDLSILATLNLSATDSNFVGIAYNKYKNVLYVSKDDNPVSYIVCGTGDLG